MEAVVDEVRGSSGSRSYRHQEHIGTERRPGGRAPGSHLVDIELTSMDMVALMLKVEAELEIMLPQHEITPENFKSVRTLETVILNQLGAGWTSERRRSLQTN